MRKKAPFTRLTCDGETIRVEWPNRIGALREGYATGGDYGNGVIRIAQGQTRTSQRATLFHELQHYCIERSGGISRGLTAAQTEEALCDSTDAFMTAIFRENPVFVKWFTEVF